MQHWSPARLRNGVDNWEEITPEPLRKAVVALRRAFETNAWKASEIMRQGCYPALHKGMADQTRTINDGLKKLGFPALPTVDGGEAEPSVFVAYFDRSAGLLAREVQRTFSELLAISLAQSGVIGRDPVEWATVEMKLMVADESHMIPLWTRSVCDVQPYDPNDADESIYWTKWRAPLWFFMVPFANRPYDRAKAWDRMDEHESKHLLEVVEDRFNQRLIMALEKAVDETHVRLAKQVPPSLSYTVANPAPQVSAESLSKGGQFNRPRSTADLWRDFHEKYQSLANEEQMISQRESKDRRLSAHCTYVQHLEILGEYGKPEQGPFCLLHMPECGVWSLSAGPNESFEARFRALATRTGCALGAPHGTSPEDFWLHHLFLDLLENKSKHLFAAEKDKGGMIPHVSVASAIFCSRLERKALEASALINRQDGKLREPDRGDPEVAKRRSLVRSNPTTPADELCAIFDRQHVPVPRKWQGSGLNEWRKAYKNPIYRSRIHVLLSKDRENH